MVCRIAIVISLCYGAAVSSAVAPDLVPPALTQGVPSNGMSVAVYKLARVSTGSGLPKAVGWTDYRRVYVYDWASGAFLIVNNLDGSVRGITPIGSKVSGTAFDVETIEFEGGVNRPYNDKLLANVFPSIYARYLGRDPSAVQAVAEGADGDWELTCSFPNPWGYSSPSSDGRGGIGSAGRQNCGIRFDRSGRVTGFRYPGDTAFTPFTWQLEGGGTVESDLAVASPNHAPGKLIAYEFYESMPPGAFGKEWIEGLIDKYGIELLPTVVDPEASVGAAADVEPFELMDTLQDRGRRAAGPRWSLVIGGLVLIGGALFFVIRARRA